MKKKFMSILVLNVMASLATFAGEIPTTGSFKLDCSSFEEAAFIVTTNNIKFNQAKTQMGRADSDGFTYLKSRVRYATDAKFESGSLDFSFSVKGKDNLNVKVKITGGYLHQKIMKVEEVNLKMLLSSGKILLDKNAVVLDCEKNNGSGLFCDRPLEFRHENFSDLIPESMVFTGDAARLYEGHYDAFCAGEIKFNK